MNRCRPSHWPDISLEHFIQVGTAGGKAEAVGVGLTGFELGIGLDVDVGVGVNVGVGTLVGTGVNVGVGVVVGTGVNVGVGVVVGTGDGEVKVVGEPESVPVYEAVTKLIKLAPLGDPHPVTKSYPVTALYPELIPLI